VSIRDREGAAVDSPAGAEEVGYEPGELSLADEIEALIEDGKTYIQAELSYQKTRAAFLADQAKATAVFGLAAAAFGSLALVGLTVGAIIALAPWLTAWGASALVVGLEAIAAILCARAAAKRWHSLLQVIQPDGEDKQ